MKKTADLFTANLKAAMMRRGVDYNGLARLTGLTRSGIYKIVEGFTWPSTANIDRIAYGLEMKSPAELFFDENLLIKVPPTTEEALAVIEAAIHAKCLPAAKPKSWRAAEEAAPGPAHTLDKKRRCPG